MMTNVSSDPKKNKFLLADTGQADNATGGQAKGAGWDMRGTDCGWAETWGELIWGKWNGLRHKGNWLGTNEAGWDMRVKWVGLRHEGNWLGSNGAGWDMRGTDWGQRKMRHNAQKLSTSPSPFVTLCQYLCSCSFYLRNYWYVCKKSKHK